MTEPLLLALDQGTTSTRAILFDRTGRPLAEAGRPLAQSYPADGWVEHDAEEIFAASVAVLREALERSSRPVEAVAALGITNQRETVVVWERDTGRPIAPAVVWQDRRTADVCERLRGEGAEAQATEVSGLLLDPYFSGTKLAWLLDHVEGARAAAEPGGCSPDDRRLGDLEADRRARARHDATNASRTLLFDIERQSWSAEMVSCSRAAWPAARGADCAADYGRPMRDASAAPVPIRGVAGDSRPR
jgi:glycerol kinase